MVRDLDQFYVKLCKIIHNQVSSIQDSLSSNSGVYDDISLLEIKNTHTQIILNVLYNMI